MNIIPPNSNKMTATPDQLKQFDLFLKKKGIFLSFNELPGVFAQYIAKAHKAKADKEIYAATKENSIHLLPEEVFIKIFRNFGYNELQTISSVCKSWNISVYQLANQRHESAIKFLNYLISKLNQSTYSQQIAQLESIKSRPIINIKSINHISKFYKLIEEILEILKTVSATDLDLLEKIIENKYRPELFENIFALARTFQKIDTTYTDNPVLNHTIPILVSNKLYDKAIQKSLLLPEYDAGEQLGVISINLINDGNWSKARNVLENITSQVIKKNFYKKYYNKRTKIKNLCEILNEIKKIPDEIIKCSVLESFFQTPQYTQDFFDKSLEMLSEIKTSYYKNNVLMIIAQKSFEYNFSSNFESAFEKITDSAIQEAVISHCAKWRQTFDNVLGFAKRMQNERLIASAWLGSCINDCRGNTMDSMKLAESAAEHIHIHDIQQKAYLEIANTYLFLVNKEKTFEFVDKLTNTEDFFKLKNYKYDNKQILEELYEFFKFKNNKNNDKQTLKELNEFFN